MRAPRSPSWLLLGLAGLLAGCEGESGLVRVEGSGFFNPPALEYGVRAVGDTHRLQTTLRNSSAQRIQVQGIRFEPPQEVYAAFLTTGGTLRGSVLGIGEAVEIELVYRPLAEGVYDSTLVVEAGTIEIPLDIVATARQVAPARPQVDPGRVRFFGSEVGREVSQPVRVRNAGDTDGALSGVSTTAPFSITRVGGAPLTLPTDRLRPGESLDLEVHFRPGASGVVEDTIVFQMDTGEAAALEVSGDAVEPGVLSCDRSVVDFGTAARGETPRADIRCTVDATGPYTLQAVRFAEGSSPHFRLVPEQPVLTQGSLQFSVEMDGVGLAGRHDAVVEVVPLHDVRTRVAVTIEILEPPAGDADLDVELTWNTGNSDFDLHLVRQDGRPFEPGLDCYFEDKNPDWGQPGYLGDDPVLTTDDVNGFGPEEVSLLYASEPFYDLYVQFYGFDREIPPSSTVRIRYQLRGEAPVELSRDMFECGAMWHVGRFLFDGDNRRFEPRGALTLDYRARAGESCRP